MLYSIQSVALTVKVLFPIYTVIFSVIVFNTLLSYYINNIKHGIMQILNDV